jgi:hypothetical protein
MFWIDTVVAEEVFIYKDAFQIIQNKNSVVLLCAYLKMEMKSALSDIPILWHRTGQIVNEKKTFLPWCVCSIFPC